MSRNGVGRNPPDPYFGVSAEVKPVDRRVRRTKRRLKEALLALMEERGYERITIRDITERADVGRSTFYSHFDSKEALLFSGFDAWLYSLADAAPAATAGAEPGAPTPMLRFSLPLLRHLRTQEKFFHAVMIRAVSGRVRRRLTELLAEVIRRELRQATASGARAAAVPSAPAAQCSSARPAVAGVDPESRLGAHAHALAGAFLGLAAWWLAGGGKLTPESVDALFQELAGAFGPRGPATPR